MCLCVTVVRLENCLSQNDILVYSLVGLQLGIQLSNVHGWLHHVAPAAPRGSAAIYSSSKGWVSRVFLARFGFMVGRFGGCLISQLSSLTDLHTPCRSLRTPVCHAVARSSDVVLLPWGRGVILADLKVLSPPPRPYLTSLVHIGDTLIYLKYLSYLKYSSGSSLWTS